MIVSVWRGSWRVRYIRIFLQVMFVSGSSQTSSVYIYFRARVMVLCES